MQRSSSVCISFEYRVVSLTDRQYFTRHIVFGSMNELPTVRQSYVVMTNSVETVGRKRKLA